MKIVKKLMKVIISKIEKVIGLALRKAPYLLFFAERFFFGFVSVESIF